MSQHLFTPDESICQSALTELFTYLLSGNTPCSCYMAYGICFLVAVQENKACTKITNFCKLNLRVE